MCAPSDPPNDSRDCVCVVDLGCFPNVLLSSFEPIYQLSDAFAFPVLPMFFRFLLRFSCYSFFSYCYLKLCVVLASVLRLV